MHTPPAALRPLVALAVVAIGLGAATACQTVEPGPMAHTAPTGPNAVTVGGELTGKHAEITCEACHVGQTAPFGPVEDSCLGCHAADRDKNRAGANHYPDATSCNDCHDSPFRHLVTHRCWQEAYGPCPDEVDTDTDLDTDTDADTDVDTDTDTDIPTGVSCANVACHGVTRPDAAPADGSHTAHLDAPYLLWAPVAPVGCSTCHGTGAETGANAGHADGTPTLPMDLIGLGAGLTAPAYTGGTCSGTYCHGAELVAGGYDPVWNGGPAEAACGTCHLSPPVDNNHNALMTDCTGCHGHGNNITPAVDLAPHINGELFVD